MEQKRFYSVDSYMTAMIDKVMKIDKNDPLFEYIKERIEVCNTLVQGGLTERVLIEIKLILKNIEKRLKA